MKSRIKYTDEPMGKLRVMKDFLPPPDKLVLIGIPHSGL